MSSGNINTVEQIEALLGRPAAPVMRKQISALDEGCRAVLARSPIAAFGYRDAGGTSQTTFVGGRPGFARMLSPTVVSFSAPPAYGPISLFFLLPGVGEVLRVNGTMKDGKVTVQEAYVHCAQAVLRSRLWQPPGPAAPVPQVPGDGPLNRPEIAGFLAAAPFLAVSTWDTKGGSDTSPRGDQGAVARIRDGRTLVIADRKGNKRADTLHNLLADDRLSLAALVPGRAGILQVRGRATVTDDPVLLATLELRGMPPHAALLVDVEHAEVTESDAVTGARLWSPDGHVAPDEAPDLMVLAGVHLAANSGRGGRMLRALWAIPGIDRLLRRVMTSAYRSGLRKEGYADSALRAVRIAEVRRETPSTVTLVLTDPGGGVFDFRPGQFFTLVGEIGGREVRRAYSASSAPGSPTLEVTVKRIEGGRFSTHVHRRLRAGGRLALRGPAGTFHLVPTAPIVLVAAGSGVTPMMSMIRTRLSGAEPGRIHLLYSSRSETETIFAAELARLAAAHPGRLSVTHVLTERDDRLDTDGVRQWILDVDPGSDAHYYTCGPEPLMDAVHTAATGLGVPASRVHSERFTGGGVITTTEPQEMTVEDDGRPVGTTVVAAGQTLLDAGLAAGLPMPYSCTAGGCGECAVRLLGGQVTRVEEDGSVLACVSCPLSAVRVDVGTGQKSSSSSS